MQGVGLIYGRLLLIIGTFLCAAHLALADVPVPPYRMPVTDLTGTLSPALQQDLTRRIQQLEARKGAQVAVLLLPTTGPETIESYALRVGEAWKLGRPGVDDGVVFVIAKSDRAMRIEVGYGLEGALPDAVAKRITSDIITPFFQRGDIPGGVAAGLDRLIASIEGEPLPAPPRASFNMNQVSEKLPFVIIGFALLGNVLRALFGRLLAGLLCGGVVGVFVWMTMHVLPIAIVAGIIVCCLIAISGTSSGRATRYGGHRYGGFNSGGGYRRSSGGGGFSGGFSGGGGGRFGGGGASGRW